MRWSSPLWLIGVRMTTGDDSVESTLMNSNTSSMASVPDVVVVVAVKGVVNPMYNVVLDVSNTTEPVYAVSCSSALS